MQSFYCNFLLNVYDFLLKFVQFFGRFTKFNVLIGKHTHHFEMKWKKNEFVCWHKSSYYYWDNDFIAACSLCTLVHVFLLQFIFYLLIFVFLQPVNSFIACKLKSALTCQCRNGPEVQLHHHQPANTRSSTTYVAKSSQKIQQILNTFI